VGNFGGPELWVRNVSQPTLRPFPPAAAKATGAAMVVVPGGAFMGLAMDREGYSVAAWLNQRGIAAFVLKYRLAPTPASPEEAAAEFARRLRESVDRLPKAHTTFSGAFSPDQRAAISAAREDALEAVRYVRQNAATWHLSTNRIGIMGFSAGAITALSVATTSDAASRPDLVAAVYGGLADDPPVPSTVPPIFIAAAADDPVAQYCPTIYEAWHMAGAEAELHILATGGHGFGTLHQGKSSDQWLDLFDHWLAAHEFDSH
jgi:acetyl esterase/lipase